MLWVGVAILVLLLVSGAPIYVAFGVSSIFLLLFYAGMPAGDLSALFFHPLWSQGLLAMPFFILAGNVMAYGGMSRSLMDLARAFVGHLPGGLGLAVVLAAAFFGACSGSGIAATVAIGSVFIPVMAEYGYRKDWSAAVVACAGPIGYMIPPSITFVLLGEITGQSVGTLFIAGVVPGLMLTALLCITVLIMARRDKLPSEPAWAWRDRGKAFVRAFPALLMPIFVLGSIYAGMATPTEAAGLSMIYAIFIGLVFYKGLRKFENFSKAIKDGVRSSAIIYIIIGTTVLMGKVLTYAQIPQAITALVTSLNVGQMAFILATAVFFIFMGMFFEAVVYTFVCLPLILPSLNALGVDMVFYAALFVALVIIGQVTPPVGVVLYAAASVSGESPERIARHAVPFLMALVVGVLIMIAVPQTATFLPSLLGR